MKKLVLPIILSTITATALAEDDKKHSSAEYYGGFNIGISKLIDTTPNASVLDLTNLTADDRIVFMNSTYSIESTHTKSSTQAKGHAKTFNFGGVFGFKLLSRSQFFLGAELQGTVFKEQFEQSTITVKTPFKYAITKYTVKDKAKDQTFTLPLGSPAQLASVDSEQNPATGTSHHITTKQVFDYKRKFSVSGDALLGKRFNISDGITFDAFAVIGYGHTQFEKKVTDKTNPVLTHTTTPSNNYKNILSKQVPSDKTPEQYASGEPTVEIINPLLDITRTAYPDALNQGEAFYGTNFSTDEYTTSGANIANTKSASTDSNSFYANGLRYGAGFSFNFNRYSITAKYVKAKLVNADILGDIKSDDLSVAFTYRF